MDNQKKVIGVRHAKGEFNGNSYDNYIVYIAWEGETEDLSGLCPSDTVKVKAKELDNFLSNLGIPSLTDLIGLYVEEVFYNQYRQAVSIVLDL